MSDNDKHLDYTAIREKNEKKYGTDIGRIGKMLLADRYADRTHFIFELLQNAEDALAKRQDGIAVPALIKFEISNEVLTIRHYGKPFDEKDVRGICGIDESTKGNITAIGRFGIGFKSVYAFTDLPEIHSGKEHFAIENYVWPKEVQALALENNETRIILPLRVEAITDDYKEIVSGLKRIDLKSLLFLHHIEEIEWTTNDGESGTFIRSQAQKLDSNVRKVELIGESNIGECMSENWIIFSKEISNRENTGLLEIAFLMKDDKIQTINRSPLIVFFPTVVTTNLGFLAHGPYRTTPSRDNIPVKDAWNQECINKTGILVVEALRWLRDKQWLTVDSIQCFPINKTSFDEENMFSSFYTLVKEAFINEPLLPKYKGNYIQAKQALIAGTKDLRNLLNIDQLSLLFGKNYQWLDEGISQDRTPDLRKYLIDELAVTEIKPETIINNLGIDFLEKQTDTWIRELYEFLNKQKALHEEIKTMPIIRLSDSSHVTPYKNGKPSVFLPGKETEFPTVHKAVCNTDASLEFLVSLGLREPNLVDNVIRNILPKFDNPENNFTVETYKQAMSRILEAYTTDSENQRNRLISELKTKKFVAVVDAVLGKHSYELPSNVYFPTDSLTTLFSGIKDIYFINEQYGLKGDKYRSLLELCGVSRNLRLIEKADDFTLQEKAQMRRDAGSIDSSWDNVKNDYTLYGLEELLYHIDKLDINEKNVKTKLLWKELHNLYERRRDSVFVGTYTWGYFQRSHSCNFDTYFIRLLNQREWIPDANGNLNRPADINFNQLGWENHEFLLSKIHFKSNEVQEFEEKTGLKVVPPEKLEKFLEWEQSQKTYGEDNVELEKEFKPSLSVADAPLRISDYQWKECATPFDSSQIDKHPQRQVSGGIDAKLENSKKEQDYQGTSEKYRKDEGNWGENYVLKALKNEFCDNNDVEIIDLNANGKTGVGADFCIKENNEIIRLVEVKTTTQPRGNPVEISGRQWETARNEFNINNGDVYWIYCVYNVDKTNPEIVRVQNPIQKWKDGLIIADPVNFVVIQ
jgi:hypothetical protein